MTTRSTDTTVNDTHSSLNPTVVQALLRPRSADELGKCLELARQSACSLSVCGGRHAMGGQQFLSGSMLLDMRGLNRLLKLDCQRGLVEVEGGVTWGELINLLAEAQPDPYWTIRQKPTGADDISIAGSISSNAHGRGLSMQPLVGDIESLRILTAKGEMLTASRTEHQELFRRVVGGYGAFGVIYSATLRLQPIMTLQRIVDIATVDELVERFAERKSVGCLYGDFQFAIDNTSNDFLYKGILSCYKPVADATVKPAQNKALSLDQWSNLLRLAHADKRKAFEEYSRHYLATNNQLYLSDRFQLSTYKHNYHKNLDKHLGSCGSEVITELYVPPSQLESFMSCAASYLRRAGASVVYGTIRLIEQDDVTLLPWARSNYVCIIFNLHVEHSAEGKAAAAANFRKLIDLAIWHGGSFYLTYHRHARRDQVERCYNQFASYLADKQAWDPNYVLDSDWLRHMRRLFADDACA